MGDSKEVGRTTRVLFVAKCVDEGEEWEKGSLEHIRDQ